MSAVWVIAIFVLFAIAGVLLFKGKTFKSIIVTATASAMFALFIHLFTPLGG